MTIVLECLIARVLRSLGGRSLGPEQLEMELSVPPLLFLQVSSERQWDSNHWRARAYRQCAFRFAFRHCLGLDFLFRNLDYRMYYSPSCIWSSSCGRSCCRMRRWWTSLWNWNFWWRVTWTFVNHMKFMFLASYENVFSKYTIAATGEGLEHIM